MDPEAVQPDAAPPLACPDPPRPEALQCSDGDFPCPGKPAEGCKIRDWLTSRARAGQVYAYLSSLDSKELDARQWNDLGCVHAWAGDWGSAVEAFETALKKAGADEEEKLIEPNLRLARRAAAGR